MTGISGMFQWVETAHRKAQFLYEAFHTRSFSHAQFFTRAPLLFGFKTVWNHMGEVVRTRQRSVRSPAPLIPTETTCWSPDSAPLPWYLPLPWALLKLLAWCSYILSRLQPVSGVKFKPFDTPSFLHEQEVTSFLSSLWLEMAGS